MKLKLDPAQLTNNFAAAVGRGVDSALSQAASTILSTMNLSPEDRLATDPKFRAAQAAQLSQTLAVDAHPELKSKLVELAAGKLYGPYDLKVSELSLGARAGLDLRVKAQLISNQDPLIAEDKHRAATTQQHLSAGEPLTWAITGGGIYPRAGFGLNLPLGAANVNVGFSADASLGYSVLAPYAQAPQSALSVAKNMTVDLPFTAAGARALEPGTEVTLRGQGRLAASASIGLGAELAKAGDLVSIGASFGSSAGASKALELSLRVKRLSGNQVFVAVSKVDTTATSAAIGGHAGVGANLNQSVLAQLGGGGVLVKAGNLAADQLEAQIAAWVNLDFRAAHSTAANEQEMSTYVVDLSTAEGRSAYEAMMKLDFRAVDQLAVEGDLAVRSAKLSDRVRTTGGVLSGQFAPITLLRALSSAQDEHLQLQVGPGGKETVDCYQAALVDGYSGVVSDHFQGKRSVRRELVSTQRSSEPAPKYYYHVENRVEGDGHTSSEDVRRFLELADLLGAVDSDTKSLASSASFLSSFDDSSRTIDVYVDDAGLNTLTKVAAEHPEQLMAAYATAYERLDRPALDAPGAWPQAPWLQTKHPKYAALIELLKTGAPPGASALVEEFDPESKAYHAITGRHLGRDSAAFKASGALVQLIAQLGALPTAEARMNLLAQQDKELGLDFWKGLGTIAQVVGPEHVLVNDLRIQDLSKQRDLVFKSEGAIQDPRAEIQARLHAAEA